jgi:hypothetical protein
MRTQASRKARIVPDAREGGTRRRLEPFTRERIPERSQLVDHVAYVAGDEMRQDALFVINIAQEKVERFHALQ